MSCCCFHPLLEPSQLVVEPMGAFELAMQLVCLFVRHCTRPCTHRRRLSSHTTWTQHACVCQKHHSSMQTAQPALKRFSELLNFWRAYTVASSLRLPWTHSSTKEYYYHYHQYYHYRYDQHCTPERPSLHQVMSEICSVRSICSNM